MKAPLVLLATAALALAAAAMANDKPAKPSLSKPGFIFIELATERVPEYVDYFERVAGFKTVRKEDGYATLLSDRAELTFIHNKLLPSGHPNKEQPAGSRRGGGIEIVVIVPDLDASFAKSAEFKQQGWRVSAGIGRRPWGARDFRILSPDGYYLRFSEPM